MNARALGTLWGLMLRRDRVRSLVWIGLLSLFVLSTYTGMDTLLPTQAQRDAFVLGVQHSPVQTAYLGPVFVSSIAGLTAWRTSIYAIIVGLFGLLTLTRHTRASEENGETELLLALPVGRMWVWRSALLWSLVTLWLLGSCFALVLIGLHESVAESLLFGYSFTLDGWVMIGVTAIAVQLTTSARTTNTWAGVVMGIGYFFNAMGRLNDTWVVWLSPVGWIQRTQPFAHNNWQLLVIGIVQVLVLIVGADLIAQRREYGTGLIAERPGMMHASRVLLNPWGFWGYQLISVCVLWWCGAILLSFLTLGLAQGIDTQFKSSPQLMDVMKVIGGSSNMMKAYYSFMLFLVNIIAMSAGVQCLLVVRRHEQLGLLDAWLAGVRSRQLLYLVTLSWAVVVATGVMGIYALVTGSMADQTMLTVPDALWSVAVTWPAVLATIGVMLLLFAWLPRAMGLIWLWIVANAVVVLFNDLWKLSDSIVQFLPLAFSPNILLGDAVGTYPLVVFTISLGMLVGAAWRWQRRDIG